MEALRSLAIEYQLLSEANEPLDIWIRDWGFVDEWWFRFQPSYARSLYSRRDVKRARAALEKLTKKRYVSVPLILDGGNLVHNGETAIVTEKVFSDNSHLSKSEIEHLFHLLGFERIIFIPVEPGDIIGHADGIVRFLDASTLLFNDYVGSIFATYRRKLLRTLQSADLNAELVPFSWYCTDEEQNGVPSAEGCYINFIHTKQGIVYPTFDNRQDDRANELLSQNGQRVLPIEARALARFGGVFNCISVAW